MHYVYRLENICSSVIVLFYIQWFNPGDRVCQIQRTKIWIGKAVRERKREREKESSSYLVEYYCLSLILSTRLLVLTRVSLEEGISKFLAVTVIMSRMPRPMLSGEWNVSFKCMT